MLQSLMTTVTAIRGNKDDESLSCKLNNLLVDLCKSPIDNYDIILYLLEHGANVNCKVINKINSSEYTPLLAACYSGYNKSDSNYRLIKMLLEKGAKIEDSILLSVLDRWYPFATEKTVYDVVKLLLEHGVTVLDELELILAAGIDNQELMILLLENGKGMKYLNNNVLIEAVIYGNIDLAKFLMNEHSLSFKDMNPVMIKRIFESKDLNLIQFMIDNGFRPGNYHDKYNSPKGVKTLCKD